MASTSETSVELEDLLPTAISEREDKGRNSETQLTTAFYKKTYTSGKLRFIKDNTHLSDAKFIKINADAGDNESIMQQVAEGVVNKLWRVHHKNILLSVTSGADELDEAGSEAFKEGIRHILPGTCMVTGGTNDGVTRLVGDAVHEFNNRSHYEEHDKHKCPTIGIVCLDRLGQNKDTIKPWELTRGVFGIDSDGELFTVDESGERWTLNPASLTNVDGSTATNASTYSYHVGDLVLIGSDRKKVKSGGTYPARWEDFLEPTLGRIGLIVEEYDWGPLIRVHGRNFLYTYRSVTLLPKKRLLSLLRTHFETYMPSDGQDELVKAVKNREVDNVYAIIRQAYQDFNEFTSVSLGVDCNFNFFVIDANGDRTTFTRDDVRKQITGHGKSDDDIPYNFAPGDQVMIRDSADIRTWSDTKCYTRGKVGTVLGAGKDSLILRVCEESYTYGREDVTLMNRERFNLLKKHFQTHSPVCQGDELQQAVIKDDFEKVTAIIRKAYKDAERICEYQLTTAIDDLQDKVHTERNLDPHHNLFVVVESSTLDEFGGEIEFRANLEKRISSEMIRSRMKGKIYQDRPVLQVPLVNLVLKNDQYTLETVKSAMDKGIHSVVVITTESDTRKRQDSAISDSKNEITSKMLRNSTIPNDAIKTFQETYQEQLHLLAVISLRDMSCMLEENIFDLCFDGVSLGICPLDWVLYDLCKADIVKQWVCTDDIRKKRINRDAFAFTMNYFLIHNDVEVIEALVQLDFDMNSAWIDGRQYIELCDVEDGVLKRLKAKIKDIPMVSSLMQRVQARPVHGEVKDIEDALLPTIYSSAKQLNTEELLPYWEYMFIWSLLLRKHKIAKIIWTKTEHPLFMALIACNLCEAVKKNTHDKVLIVEMENILSVWSTVAIDCLNECYQISADGTYNHLKMTMPFWYTQSCLDLAVESRNMEFLAQQACRNLVGDVWNGDIYLYVDPYSLTNWIKFLKAPKTKFACNVISFLVFLILFAYVLLFDLPKTVSTKEFVLMTWVLTILVEEVRQMHQIYQMPGVQRIRNLKNYFLEGWNCIDLSSIVMFLLGYGLIQFRGTSFDWHRVVLAVDFVVFFFRLAHIFSVQKILGPKLIIIRKMVQDLLYFLAIMAVFVLAYAIASYSILYPNSPVTWETARQIIEKPYWHLYGELFLEDMEDSTDCTNDAILWTNGTSKRCPTETGRIVGPFMMGVYLLFSNILLLNLLIAMFSYTFTTIHEHSDKIWCFQRYVIVKEYALRPVLCPPVNVFWHIYKLFQWCLHKCTLKPLDDPFHVLYDETIYVQGRIITISEFMTEAQRRYREMKETESDNSIETANKKLDNLKNEAKKEAGFRKQALECFEALNKKVYGLETKAEREDEFKRLILSLQAQLNTMQESIDSLHRKKADSEHKADEETENLSQSNSDRCTHF